MQSTPKTQFIVPLNPPCPKVWDYTTFSRAFGISSGWKQMGLWGDVTKTTFFFYAHGWHCLIKETWRVHTLPDLSGLIAHKPLLISILKFETRHIVVSLSLGPHNHFFQCCNYRQWAILKSYVLSTSTPI